MIASLTFRPITHRAAAASRPGFAATLAVLRAGTLTAALAAMLAASPGARAAPADAVAAMADAVAPAPADATSARVVAPPRARQIGQYSGFEGREIELGRKVAASLRDSAPTGADARYDFSGREAMLGLAMTQVVRTLNHNQGYQHEMNDALVKMTLDHIMFAKRHGMLKQLVDEDINGQRQQLERVRKLMDRTGNRDLAIVAIFEQTACFFQLVDRTERAPGRVTYRSPYRTVLAETVRMGIHDLSEREIHEAWTIPRMQAYARVLGLELDVTPWQEDGMVTVSVRGGV